VDAHNRHNRTNYNKLIAKLKKYDPIETVIYDAIRNRVDVAIEEWLENCVTAQDIIDECTPYYSADHDEEHLPPLGDLGEGYDHVEDYFPSVDSDAVFRSRSEAIAALAAAYAGPDKHGVGFKLPEV
jgi:hypothetical protein